MIIIGLAILYICFSLIIFYTSKIFKNPLSLRRFLGINPRYESEDDYSETAYWLSKIGQTLEVISFIGFLFALLVIMSGIFNMGLF